MPEAHRFLEVSAGSVTLHLNAWLDGGCPIKYFVVEYKPRSVIVCLFVFRRRHPLR